ncbi:MAG: EFR1 family ferrodoxin [Bacillota bacterium]
MKTVIYYFSGTGNSLKVAKDLSEKLGDTILVAIPTVMSLELDPQADNIGIVYPVYCWGIPQMVTKFLNKLRPEHAKYFFAVATYGGSAAGTLLQAKQRLKKQNIKLASGFVVHMPTNYIVMGEALEKEEQDKLFQSWNKRIGEIANIIRNQKEHVIESGSLLSNFFFSKVLYSMAIPSLAKADKSFWSDSNCNQCGICKRVCPADNIEYIDNKPVWNHKCEQCLACLHWCPQQSIQHGKKTEGRNRYTNPSVSLKEVMMK